MDEHITQWTDEIDSSILVTSTHTPGEENTLCYTGPHGTVLRNSDKL